MIRLGVRLSRAATTTVRNASFATAISTQSPPPFHQPFRLLHNGINASIVNPVALQMINYAFSHARSLRSDESYAQGLLVLEQCLWTQLSEAQNSKGAVLLAMATLLSERGNLDEAVEKLQRVQDLTLSSMGVRVAAIEALVGLHLELGQDDASSVLADKCLELLEENKSKASDGSSVAIITRAKAVKGLVELVHGNFESAKLFFHECQDDRGCTGSVALSYGEYLHATQNFMLAKELYQKAIKGVSENEDCSEQHASLSACTMSFEEVQLAATCALGQLEAHLGNFADAEEILTSALTKSEERFGTHHPKVGVILTCIALLFRRKAMQEHSSSLLIQEGLYRRAIEFLKAPPLETEESKVDRRDIVALARGGYGEALCVQKNRRGEGEKLRNWAEAAWNNHRLSLAEALEISELSSNVPIIDARISRVI